MKLKITITTLLTFIVALPIIAQTFGEQPTYPGRSNYKALRWEQASAYYSYLMYDLHQRDSQRQTDLQNTFRSKEKMQNYIKDVKKRLKGIVGTLPERGKLNSLVVGKIQGDGFTVEKIVFQSTPGRYVTCHLYLPQNKKGPFPASIEMCGHGLNGKGNGSLLAMRMAVNGIATLVVDPIAQGERLQIIDGKGHPLTRGVTTEHTLLNPLYNLLGSSLAAQEFFDNSRAIDYLLTRKDIDGEHIGAYGFSGGGTQATYLIALDERIKVGCIGLFFSSRARTLEIQGPSDGCQQIPGEGKEGIEISDFAMMMAPKPLILLDGKYDFVDYWGALQGFEELKKCYTALGHPEKVDQYFAEDGHATPTDVQARLVQWFMKWLIGNKEPLIDVKNPTWEGKDMLCTSIGQVNLEYKDAVSVMDEVQNLAEKLQEQRETFRKSDKGTIRKELLSILGLKERFAKNPIEAVSTGQSKQREYEEFRYQINCSGEMPVACVVWIPSNATKQSTIEIHLHEQGKADFLTDLSKRDGVFNGTIIVSADFRGLGEMEDPYIYNYAKYWNKEYRCAATSMHIGRPIMGQRVADLHTLLDFCSSDEKLKGHPITVVADGVYGPVVMHESVLDNRIKKAILSRCLKSWKDYIANPLQRDMYSNILYGALNYYDLPDLITLSNNRVKVID